MFTNILDDVQMCPCADQSSLYPLMNPVLCKDHSSSADTYYETVAKELNQVVIHHYMRQSPMIQPKDRREADWQYLKFSG